MTISANYAYIYLFLISYYIGFNASSTVWLKWLYIVIKFCFRSLFSSLIAFNYWFWPPYIISFISKAILTYPYLEFVSKSPFTPKLMTYSFMFNDCAPDFRFIYFDIYSWSFWIYNFSFLTSISDLTSFYSTYVWVAAWPLLFSF